MEFRLLCLCFLIVPGLTLWTSQLLHMPSIYAQVLGGHDSFEYFALMQNMLQTGNFSFDGLQPSTIRPPGYPLFLLIFWPLANILGWDVYLLIQALMTGGIAWLTYRWVGLWGNRTLASLSCLMVAAYLPLHLMAVSLLSDTLYTVLLLAALIQLTKGLQASTQDKAPLLPWIYTGLFLGAANLTRPATLLLPFLLVPLCWYAYRQRKKPTLVMLLTYLLCLTPWIARNHQVAGRPVLVASLTGFNLWQATFYANVWHNNHSLNIDPAIKKEYLDLKQGDYFIDHRAEKRFLHKAKERIQAAPFHYAAYSALRSLVCWTAIPGTRELLFRHPPVYFVLSACQIVFLGLALWGLFYLPQPWSSLLLVILAYTFVLHAGLNMLTRYLLPIYPLLLIGLAQSSALLWARWKPKIT